MKKIFTILCAASLAFSVAAQTTDAGNMMVGVNSNFTFESTSPETGDAVSNMELGGTYGYFFMDNLAGIALFDYSKNGDADAETGFGIGARYYIGGIYAGAHYMSGPVKKASSINIGAGYAMWLNDNITLEPSLTYSMKSFDGESNGSKIALKIGFGLYF